jgi:hypothetical protein
MRKSLKIGAFLLASLPCFGIGSVVQSNLGGNVTSSAAADTPCTASPTGHFATTTTSGNTLVLVAWGVSTTNSVFSVTMSWSASTSGVTWIPNSGNRSVLNSSPVQINGVAMFYAPANASVSSGTTVTVTGAANWDGNTSTSSCAFEFALYEITGLTNPSVDYSGATGLSQTSSTPSTTWSFSGFSAFTGFVIQAFAGGGSTNLTAGSGYTLGPSATTAIVGQTQYAGGQSHAGTASYVGTSPYWVSLMFWIADGSSTVSVVRRHRGFVN